MKLKTQTFSTLCLYILACLLLQKAWAKTEPLPTHLNEHWTKVRLSSLPGLWRKDGYAEMLAIFDGTAYFVEISEVHCLLRASMTIEAYEAEVPYVLVNQSANAIKTDPELNPAETHSYGYTLLDDLPQSCVSGINEPDVNPLNNFLTFWQVFNQHYAYFEVRGVDWQALFNEHIKVVRKLDDSPANQQILFQILSEMILSLTMDGHSGITFVDPNNPENNTEVSPGGFRAVDTRLQDGFQTAYPETVLQKLFQDQTDFDDFAAFVDHMYGLFIINVLGEHYQNIAGYMQADSYQIAAAGNIGWGKMMHNVGYLEVSSMGEFSDDPNATVEDLMNELDRVMNQVMLDLKDTQAMVIDVRLNQGGLDAAGYAIAKRFFDQERLVFTKKTKDGKAFTNEVEISIAPTDDAYLKPVYVLISPVTASAAETFTSAMSELPHVMLIGEKTNGVFSDILELILPNGWSMSLSNEVYLNSQGQSHEYIGLSPNITQPMLDQHNLERGIDPALDAVLVLESVGDMIFTNSFD